MYQIYWRMKHNGYTGHGSPLTKEIAESSVEFLNNQHPEMEHWAVEVPNKQRFAVYWGDQKSEWMSETSAYELKNEMLMDNPGEHYAVIPQLHVICSITNNIETRGEPLLYTHALAACNASNEMGPSFSWIEECP